LEFAELLLRFHTKRCSCVSSSTGVVHVMVSIRVRTHRKSTNRFSTVLVVIARFTAILLITYYYYNYRTKKNTTTTCIIIILLFFLLFVCCYYLLLLEDEKVCCALKAWPSGLCLLGIAISWKIISTYICNILERLII